MSPRGDAAISSGVSMAFMLRTQFCFWLCFFLWLPKIRTKFDSIFVLDKIFSTFLGLIITLGFLSFSVFTSKHMDLESDHLGSYPKSTAPQFWGLSKLVVTSEDNNRFTSWGHWEANEIVHVKRCLTCNIVCIYVWCILLCHYIAQILWIYSNPFYIEVLNKYENACFSIL